ncbi:MAG: hypothetical protein GF310_09880 [candidate division Zixibacteria bacterium]|nr:hypothetical protein [candidate division Zixibacteria bacterium]
MRSFRALVLAAILVVFLCSAVMADFTAKTETTTSGFMGMGGMTSENTYLIKKDKIAIATTMDMPAMGQGQKGGNTRMILRKNGKELVTIDYNKKTYSVMDEKMIDSMAAMFENLGGMADSLKEMMTVETMESKMTGNTKKIQGLKAEEMTMNMHMIMEVKMMGPEPTPIDMKMSGNMWGTKDFDGHESYAKMIEGISTQIMSGSGGGLSGIMPLMEAFDIDQETMDEAMEFAKYIPIEGAFNMNMEIPNMPMNMTINTELVETSGKAIPDSEFEVPEGFKQVEPDFDFGGGGMAFPGMGQ